MRIPERHSVHANGIDISYLKSGAGDPFLMIHGLMSNALDFCFQFEEFESRFTCYAPDVRGSGMSKTSDPLSVSLDLAVDDMLEFITEVIPIEKKMILMGHSFGGIIALELLGRIPERIRAAVIVSSPAAIATKRSSKVGITLFNNAFPLLKPISSSKVLIDVYSHFININAANLTPDTKSILKERNSLIDSDCFVAMKGYFNSVMEWELDAASINPDIPAALFFGDRDLLYSRKDTRALKRTLPGASATTISGTGHSCMQEKPDVFNTYLREFFAQHDI